MTRASPISEDDLVDRQDATDVRFSSRSLLIVTAVLAVCLSALGAFIRHFPADVRPRLAVLWAIFAAFQIALVAYHARRRYVAEQQAGCVLFSLVPHSYYIPRAPDLARLCCGVLLLATAPALWIAYSFTIALAARGQGLFPTEPYVLYGLLGSGAGITCLWWRRVRLGEHGLVVRSRYVAWDECFRWHWDACNKNVAVIYCQRTYLALIVPAPDRVAIESMLKEKVVYRRLNEPIRTNR